jgi:CRISPR type III-A-associated RAMP protein Csm4
MNPGLVVKLRPAGPWRIGPDSGARNRVDVIYHSDSLYSAVTSAMARLGLLEDWLEATARSAEPAVCFSSCFPFLDDIGLVVPPRNIWPPTSPALMSARVRWKSARFVPISVVQAILAGRKLDANQWSVDGASECLVPAGRPGPFRTGVRWSAAVDRLTGATERHSTACMEFRPGAGLWTVVSFASAAARDRWSNPVKTAFRLLADSGFGGERSRGWGRSETPEFTEGNLPEMILGGAGESVAPVPPAVAEPEPVEPETSSEASVRAESPVEPLTVSMPEAEVAPVETPVEPEAPADVAEAVVETETAVVVAESVAESEAAAVAPAEPAEPEAAVEPAADEAVAEPEAPAAEIPEMPEMPMPEVLEAPVETVEAETAAVAEAAATTTLPVPEAEPSVPAAPALPTRPHWLLSLFTPAASDQVDWGRGNYAVMARGGRIDSPAGSGELKKQLQMVAEGSVIYAAEAPCGSAPDVAPDGFAHPVFRAGFALSIRLPEVS